MPNSPRAFVGISGWTYPPWRGVFYPAGLVHRDELNYAASHLTSIEINGTFYALQKPASFERWKSETPPEFVFSVKGGNYITHRLRLSNATRAVANFFASGMLALDEKRGPVLWQLPPNLHFDAAILEQFFGLLPRTTSAAIDLVARSSDLPSERVWARAGEDRPIRHALEVRHESFVDETFVRLTREHDVAIVVADTAGRWPLIREVTSDFMYVRLHGDKELYASGYTSAALDDWATTIRGWLSGSTTPDGRGRDVFVYFDNDMKVRAPYDAMGLMERLRTP
jgi:uncharacterized protein YecE (DUF72 family)